MKILLAGATGALGKQLVPRLVAEGHEVVGTTRTEAKLDMLRDLAATGVVADPLDPAPPDSMRQSLAAIRHVEDAVTGADWTEGIVLRYGGFYGPGTSLSREGGEQLELIRKRRVPVVGDGGGVWSFVH